MKGLIGSGGGGGGRSEEEVRGGEEEREGEGAEGEAGAAGRAFFEGFFLFFPLLTGPVGTSSSGGLYPPFY